MSKFNLFLVLALGMFVFSGCEQLCEVSPAKLQEETARVVPHVAEIAKAAGTSASMPPEAI